jgi:hypothetical protein
MVRFGSLGRLRPIAERSDNQRGQPVDRYYIDDFLRRHAAQPGYILGDIRGRALEVGEDRYARAYGHPATTGQAGVERIDILHGDESNASATIVADLADGAGIPSDAYDCVICTQTLLLIYDLHSAVRTLQLAPAADAAYAVSCFSGRAHTLRK